MLPILEEIVKSVKIPVAALPVPYLTTPAEPNFQTLTHQPIEGGDRVRCFPDQLDSKVCTRYQMAEFAKRAQEIGVKYIGVCCGGAPHHVRAMADALGRKPLASEKNPDMSKHIHFGNDSRLDQKYKDTIISEFNSASKS